MNRQRQKEIIKRRQEQFTNFNNWESQLKERPDSAICLSAVFELYDMMPDMVKQRPVDVTGIVKMRSGLACLA